MPTTSEKLPDGATTLIAVARVAHRDGDRKLERSALDKLAREYGMTVNFTCEESVARDLARVKEGRRDG